MEFFFIYNNKAFLHEEKPLCIHHGRWNGISTSKFFSSKTTKVALKLIALVDPPFSLLGKSRLSLPPK